MYSTRPFFCLVAEVRGSPLIDLDRPSSRYLASEAIVPTQRLHVGLHRNGLNLGHLTLRPNIRQDIVHGFNGPDDFLTSSSPHLAPKDSLVASILVTIHHTATIHETNRPLLLGPIVLARELAYPSGKNDSLSILKTLDFHTSETAHICSFLFFSFLFFLRVS